MAHEEKGRKPRGEKRRERLRRRSEEKQQWRQQMGRRRSRRRMGPFLFYNVAAGGRTEGNGVCNYVWHGMTDGLGSEADNVVIYNQSPSLGFSNA